MFTALMGSRALLTLIYGGKRKITNACRSAGAVLDMEFFHKTTNFPFMATRAMLVHALAILIIASLACSSRAA